MTLYQETDSPPINCASGLNHQGTSCLLSEADLCFPVERQQSARRRRSRKDHRVTIQEELLQVLAAVGGASALTCPSSCRRQTDAQLDEGDAPEKFLHQLLPNFLLLLKLRLLLSELSRKVRAHLNDDDEEDTEAACCVVPALPEMRSRTDFKTTF